MPAATRSAPRPWHPAFAGLPISRRGPIVAHLLDDLAHRPHQALAAAAGASDPAPAGRARGSDSTASRTPTARRAVATSRGPRAADGRGYWSSRRPARWSRRRPGDRPMVSRDRRRSRTSSWSRFFLAFAPARSDPWLLSLVRRPSSVAGPPVLRVPWPSASAYNGQRTTDNGQERLMATPRLAAFEPNPIWQRSREPIFWLDPELKLAWVNRAWEELTGYPGGVGHRADLPGARADAGRRLLRPGGELPPAGGVDRGPAGGRPDVDLPRRRRTAVAPGRVLAVLRRPRRDDRPAGDRAGK